VDAGAAPPALTWPRSGLHGAVRLHHRDDFVQGEWPEGLREQASALADGSKVGTAWFARLVFAAEVPEELRRAQFLLAEVPAAAGRQHIIRREPPPPPR
jgi:hypothetical protein